MSDLHISLRHRQRTNVSSSIPHAGAVTDQNQTRMILSDILQRIRHRQDQFTLAQFHQILSDIQAGFNGGNTSPSTLTNSIIEDALALYWLIYSHAASIQHHLSLDRYEIHNMQSQSQSSQQHNDSGSFSARTAPIGTSISGNHLLQSSTCTSDSPTGVPWVVSTTSTASPVSSFSSLSSSSGTSYGRRASTSNSGSNSSGRCSTKIRRDRADSSDISVRTHTAITKSSVMSSTRPCADNTTTCTIRAGLRNSSQTFTFARDHLDEHGIEIFTLLGEGSNGSTYHSCFFQSCRAVVKFGTSMSYNEYLIAKYMGQLGIGPRVFRTFACPARCSQTGNEVHLTAIVMEQLDYTFSEYASQHVLTKQDATELTQLLRQFADTGAIHHDLKGNNIMVRHETLSTLPGDHLRPNVQMVEDVGIREAARNTTTTTTSATRNGSSSIRTRRNARTPPATAAPAVAVPMTESKRFYIIDFGATYFPYPLTEKLNVQTGEWQVCLKFPHHADKIMMMIPLASSTIRPPIHVYDPTQYCKSVWIRTAPPAEDMSLRKVWDSIVFYAYLERTFDITWLDNSAFAQQYRYRFIMLNGRDHYWPDAGIQSQQYIAAQGVCATHPFKHK